MALFCLTVLLAARGWSEHVPQLEWMAPYRAADGGSCCGITDCFRAQVTLLSEPTDEFVRVLVSSVQDWGHRQVWVNTVVIVPGRSIYRCHPQILRNAFTLASAQSHIMMQASKNRTPLRFINRLSLRIRAVNLILRQQTGAHPAAESRANQR
jgi:hypothetical protein